jgi:hypothetical protein
VKLHSGRDQFLDSMNVQRDFIYVLVVDPAYVTAVMMFTFFDESMLEQHGARRASTNV